MKNKDQFMGVEEQSSKEYLFQMYHRGQSQRLVLGKLQKELDLFQIAIKRCVCVSECIFSSIDYFVRAKPFQTLDCAWESLSDGSDHGMILGTQVAKATFRKLENSPIDTSRAAI